MEGNTFPDNIPLLKREICYWQPHIVAAENRCQNKEVLFVKFKVKPGQKILKLGNNELIYLNTIKAKYLITRFMDPDQNVPFSC